MNLKKIYYNGLNSRQKENYNFQKVSAVLADYGFVTIRLSDDWQGADFIAQHIDGETFIKVQLKSRLSFAKKYIGKGLMICFPYTNGNWYLYSHDELLDFVIQSKTIGATTSWQQGAYSMKSISKELLKHLEQFKL